MCFLLSTAIKATLYVYQCYFWPHGVERFWQTSPSLQPLCSTNVALYCVLHQRLAGELQKWYYRRHIITEVGTLRWDLNEVSVMWDTVHQLTFQTCLYISVHSSQFLGLGVSYHLSDQLSVPLFLVCIFAVNSQGEYEETSVASAGPQGGCKWEAIYSYVCNWFWC